MFGGTGDSSAVGVVLRVAVLTTPSAFTGNACLAQRIKSFVEAGVGATDGSDEERAGHKALECVVLSHTSYQTPRDLDLDCERRKIKALIGIHAYRSGRLLQGSRIPYLIVLGGTDTTIFLQSAQHVDVMRAAIHGARELVCFASWMATTMEQAIGSIPCPVTIIPQGISSKLEVTPTYEPAFHLRKRDWIVIYDAR
ncbi:hypothetical protein PTSG_02363 [Salpingoeca rosetta]|uniref:Uncharacterized protein n=1 Tax=Salpingoeca rosetta (strain ATCC 50818 / BSB-021) TaxID=946362 RepID=F2U1Z5_SALR5|nr:uncharacterized protein PTSG_02363 [Salpingoeca rosetta]EGD81647.1 hypothetical protein PTSG_02363 [Salpingoeca rosetta]|eukprot:XP_004996851.1 hypothetical protein PTSG_02363 [Salpingoeca rosetta]